MYIDEKNGWSFDYGLPPGKDILFSDSPSLLNYSPIFEYFIFVKTSLLDVIGHRKNAETAG